MSPQVHPIRSSVRPPALRGVLARAGLACACASCCPQPLRLISRRPAACPEHMRAWRSQMAQGTPVDLRLADLNFTSQLLDGSINTTSVNFGLPASWRLEGGAQLQLHFAATVIGWEAAPERPITAGRLALRVMLNGQRIGLIPIADLDREYDHVANLGWPAKDGCTGRSQYADLCP